MFVIEDLFALGIGLDVAGAYLLARGLLQSPRALARGATYGGLYPGGLVDAIEERVTGSLGIGALLLGFVFQAAGYALVLGIGATGDTSVGRAITAIAIGAIAVAAIVGGERLMHGWRFRRLLIRVAREDVKTSVTCDAARVDILARVAEYLGHQRGDDETRAAFARRIWGVDDVREPDDG